MNRREFLRLGGAGALSMMTGGYGVASADARKDDNRIAGHKIDFHAHAILPSYIEGLARLGIDAAAEEGFPLPKWTLEAHLQFMADAGIDYSVLSMPSPHVYGGDEKLSAEVARAINEEMAALCRKYPDKFGFAATLPLPYVESSIEEIRRAAEMPGALGVKVASNSGGVYLGDARLDPVFAELDARKSLVILHPGPARQLPREGVVTGRVMALYEYPADTTRAALNMLANGTLERFPNIRLIIPHTGSFLPYMKSRARGMFGLLASLGMMEPVSMEKGVAKLWFDLAGDPMPEQMDMLLKITDSGRLVYGSDYPYVPAPILLERKRALDEELRRRGWMEKIYSGNAAKLGGIEL